jgi:uncharacterized hydrophobic protein (TIGR00271 family)
MSSTPRKLDTGYRWAEAILRRVSATTWAFLSSTYTPIDRSVAIASLAEGGGLSVGYSVLTILSAAIAVLGLLLSSPAVIIGAMLISPLMGPIVLFGYSLAMLDQKLVLRSLLAITAGTALAIGVTSAIVWLSPLQTATPEILSRTNPNFFDLLVAIFSGAAGAYAAVHRKGETLVGVAIATALMPPLAVVGFGLATGNSAIRDGAAGLFMTNLLAIGLTASVVAKLFGFGSRTSGRAAFWQGAAIVAVFVVLSIPLGLSLKQIATEAVETEKIRAVLHAYFPDDGDRIYSVNVAFPKNRPIEIEALVLVKNVVVGATGTLQQRLRDALQAPVILSLSQVPLRPHATPDEQSMEALEHRLEHMPTAPPPPRPPPDMSEIVAIRTSLPLLDISSDSQTKRAVLHIGQTYPAKLADLQSAVSTLRKAYPAWTFGLDENAYYPSMES